MPAKKTVSTTETKKAAVNTEEAKKDTTVKKTTAKKTTTKAAPKKATAKKAADKKETVEKETAKKPATKKAAAKKPAAKKSTTKKTTKKVEEPVVNKKSVKDYEDFINWKKGVAHAMDWLYIEVNANDLLTEVEAGVDNLDTTCQAIMNCMLEGDVFVVEPTGANKVSPALSVRYYCDNLSEDRKKYFER